MTPYKKEIDALIFQIQLETERELARQRRQLQHPAFRYIEALRRARRPETRHELLKTALASLAWKPPTHIDTPLSTVARAVRAFQGVTIDQTPTGAPEVASYPRPSRLTRFWRKLYAR